MDFAILVFASLVGLTLPTTINALSCAIRVDCSCRWWRLALAILAWIALTRRVLLALRDGERGLVSAVMLEGGDRVPSVQVARVSRPRSMPISPVPGGNLSAI